MDADFRNLRARVAARATDQSQLDKAAEADAATTLAEIRRILTGIEQGAREAAQAEFNSRRDSALRVLDQCRRLSHMQDAKVPPLQQCRKAAIELLSAISDCE